MYEIKLAEASDAEEIAALYGSLVGMPGCTWDEHYPTVEHVRRDIENSSMYKVTENGKIIASAYLGDYEEIRRLDCFKSKKLGELGRVGVRREFHRRGVAETLLKFLLKEALKRGFDGIALLVGRQNAAALALYEKTGFKRVGESDLYDTEWYCCEYIFGKASDVI